MIGIYVIKCKVNDRFYIGVSKNIEDRWKEHKSDLKNNKHHSIKLQRCYNKYGASNFEYLIIYKTDDYIAAINLESAMIKAFYGKTLLNSSINTRGFGIGYKHSNESKAKISKALMGNKYTLGYKHTEKSKQKQREASTGNPTRFKPLTAYIKDGITYLGSIEASIKTNIPRTTLMKHAKYNKNGWSSTSLVTRE
jgi:group I intron endonuclease